MPKGTPDQGLSRPDTIERLVAVDFRPITSRTGRRMFAVEPIIVLEPVAKTGALPSNPPVHRDELGHEFGPSHRRPDGTKSTVYTPGVGQALLGR